MLDPESSGLTAIYIHRVRSASGRVAVKHLEMLGTAAPTEKGAGHRPVEFPHLAIGVEDSVTQDGVQVRSELGPFLEVAKVVCQDGLRWQSESVMRSSSLLSRLDLTLMFSGSTVRSRSSPSG